MTKEHSFPKTKIKFLLLEGVSESAVEQLNASGYTNIECLSTALDESELLEKIKGVHFVGIRSRTRITQAVIDAADKLMGVGCFCIGTNQVDLDYAARVGLPVFNAPHSNTRSVAELVLAEIVALSRGLTDKNMAVHKGEWPKSAAGSHEVRGKTLGIIGYGHIGSQLSILAESFGLRVIYHDRTPKLPMGNATQLSSLKMVLEAADFVSLHVPAASDTVDLINKDNIVHMKKGAMLINASRGNVVEIDALVKQLKSGDLAGAAIDVFPKEPASNREIFSSPLLNMKNVILTPHIGGSTLEAQVNIGREVAEKFAQFSDQGSSTGAVNFPVIDLPPQAGGHHRLLHIHQNQPGVLGAINKALADTQSNILGQYLQTSADIGYVVIDVESGKGKEILAALSAVDGTLNCRILY